MPLDERITIETKKLKNRLTAIWYILRGHGVTYRMHYSTNGSTILDPGRKYFISENEVGE